MIPIFILVDSCKQFVRMATRLTRLTRAAMLLENRRLMDECDKLRAIIGALGKQRGRKPESPEKRAIRFILMQGAAPALPHKGRRDPDA